MTETKNKKIKEIVKKTEEKKITGTQNKELLVVTRISGLVKMKPKPEETLHRLRLRKKYVTVLIHPNNKSLMGMLDSVKYFVSFGEIDNETLVKLIAERGKKVDKSKIDAEKVASELMSGKNMEDLGLKPFLRLHPPRGGIDSKKSFPKGVLGNHGKDINKLILRML